MLLIHAFKNVPEQYKQAIERIDHRIHILEKQLDYMYNNPVKYNNRISNIKQQKSILENGLNSGIVKSVVNLIEDKII